MVIKVSKIVLVVLLVTSSMVCPAQSYYGLDSVGRVDIVDDSTLQAYFVNYWRPITGSFQTISYAKHGDTLILNTYNRPRARVDTCGYFTSDEVRCSFGYKPVIAKIYCPNDVMKGLPTEYLLSYEEIAYMDTLSKKVAVILYGEESSIVVIKYSHVYIRAFVPKMTRPKRERGKEFYAVIDISGTFSTHGLYLEDFPLLETDGSLVPLNEEKNFQCWINNGFYFPQMMLYKGKKNFLYPTVEWTMGIIDLPGIFSFQAQGLCK